MGKKIKVLQIAIGDGSFSGVTNFFYSYYKYMKSKSVIFDFLYCRKNSLGLFQKDELISKSNIYELNILKENSSFNDYIHLYRTLRQILKKQKYDAVHINTGNIYVQACCIVAARNVNVCIAHSHSSHSYIHKNSKLKEIIKKIMILPCRILIIIKATHLFACSATAGEYLFGKLGTKTSKFHIIHNAINTEFYKYNILFREQVRKRENIFSDTLVFGHVGRLAEVKNHMFLIDVFNEIHKMYPNSVLWIIGDGKLKEQIKKKITALRLEECVKLFGERNDINYLLQAMDGFIFPSLFEGLSLVVVEAQTSGLPVYVSDSISKEHKITNTVKFLSLDKGNVYWADYILNDIWNIRRKDNSSVVSAAGYDINQEAGKLENFYISVAGGH